MLYDDVKKRESSSHANLRLWIRPFIDQMRRLPILGAVLLFKTADAVVNASKTSNVSSLVKASPGPTPIIQANDADTIDLSLALGIFGGALGVFMCCVVGLKSGANTATNDKINAIGRLNTALADLMNDKGNVPHSIAYAQGTNLPNRLEQIGQQLTHCKNQNQPYIIGTIAVLPTLFSWSMLKGIRERRTTLRELNDGIINAEKILKFEDFVRATMNGENERAQQLVSNTIPYDLSKIFDHMQRGPLHIAALALNAQVFGHLLNIPADKYSLEMVCAGDNTALHLALKVADRGPSPRITFINDTTTALYENRGLYNRYSEAFNTLHDIDRNTPNDIFRTVQGQIR